MCRNCMGLFLAIISGSRGLPCIVENLNKIAFWGVVSCCLLVWFGLLICFFRLFFVCFLALLVYFCFSVFFLIIWFGLLGCFVLVWFVLDFCLPLFSVFLEGSKFSKMRRVGVFVVTEQLGHKLAPPIGWRHPAVLPPSSC